MDELFDLASGPAVSGSPASADLSVFDRTFPARVAVLMRSRPITETIVGANRQEWPAATYDVATFALAAIDLVIAQQGFAEEATYDDVVDGLTTLARRTALERPASEHRRVGEYTVDALLNRGEREAPFTYRISDFTGEARTHQRRQVQFRLLVEREDPVRGEVVLYATRDAINALVGGLEFDVEDEQVANEVLLERQLAKGAFDAAERAAVRARLLSVSLAEDLHELIKNTRRDLRAVIQEWATAVPQRLTTAREHIAGRMEAEHRLLAKVRESLESDDQQVTMAAARIAALLTECSRRHAHCTGGSSPPEECSWRSRTGSRSGRRRWDTCPTSAGRSLPRCSPWTAIQRSPSGTDFMHTDGSCAGVQLGPPYGWPPLHQGDFDGEAAGHRRLQMGGVGAEVLNFAVALLGDHADHHVVVVAGRVVAADAAPDPLRYRAGPLGGVGAHCWPSRWKPGARAPLKWAA